MRFFGLLFLVLVGYAFFLCKTTSVVMNQTQDINATYQYVSSHADQIATGSR